MNILHPFRFLCSFGFHFIVNDAYVILSKDGKTRYGESYNYSCKRCGKKYQDGIHAHGLPDFDGTPRWMLPDDKEVQYIPVSEFNRHYRQKVKYDLS